MATSPSKQKFPFAQRLVLFHWFLEKLGYRDFTDLSAYLSDSDFEGCESDGKSRFYQPLSAKLFNDAAINRDTLLEYDANIVRYWKKITERRNRQSGMTLNLKYFQYLSLLAVEYYLDRVLDDAPSLFNELNTFVDRFNKGEFHVRKNKYIYSDGLPEGLRLSYFEKNELRKIAFWCATGSGKTLLMHCNIMQFQHYIAKYKRSKELNRIILVTPNEGLSKQHFDEFNISGLKADIFKKESGSLYHGSLIEIIEVSKLAEEGKEKTVSVDSFESNNLVLVDEGHRGASGSSEGAWMKNRNSLSENGFCFEYSATFGQAMSTSGDEKMTQEYARSVLFDYSYKYFYNDDFGKEYKILNLSTDSFEDQKQRYLAAAVVTFYQQLRLYKDKEKEFASFNLEKPLWIFVGSKVIKGGDNDISDVESIVHFLEKFVSDKKQTLSYLKAMLEGKSGLCDADGNDIFASSFKYLVKTGIKPDELYADILHLVFNAPEKAKLHVTLLKGADGELSLRLGDNPEFGVINVGDETAFKKKLESRKSDIVIEENAMSDSLFHAINKKESPINILIGSRKFIEGWNSWRVSMMGLMNMGRNEGSQVIQLFGRGVRLKGKNYSLKRSRKTVLNAPEYIEYLETLNVFGIRADYMQTFKNYLEEEGLPSNERMIEIILPVLNTLPNQELKTIKLKDGINFREQCESVLLEKPDKKLAKNKVLIDWYPKLDTMQSQDTDAQNTVFTKNKETFTEKEISFLDFDAIYFELQRLKSERCWDNLNIQKNTLSEILLSSDWYVLYIRKEDFAASGYHAVTVWQEIATSLLKKYCERFYTYKKAEFESHHIEYRNLTNEDPNFPKEYSVTFNDSNAELVKWLEEIKELMRKKKLKDMSFQTITAFSVLNHLYFPLIWLDKKSKISVSPVALNDGERDFIKDMERYCNTNADVLKGKDLYLLRNMSRKGIGFFEAGNFYPDFIVWIVDGKKQNIAFIDPKGTRNLEGMEDPKIKFHETIKEIETQIGDKAVKLSSFIISNTPYNEINWWNGTVTIEDFNRHNLYFQAEQKEDYIKQVIDKILTATK